MATILELATFAGVSAENVLRVVHGEPVSENIEQRVRRAIDELGLPGYPKPPPEVLPAVPAESAVPANSAARSGQIKRIQAATGDLEASLPPTVGTVVYEALRVEVGPVAKHVAELATLFDRMLQRLDKVSSEVGDERRERFEDVALLAELVTSGWRSVDRRIARLEQIVTRIEAANHPRGGPQARVYRLDDAADRASKD
jgi:tetrahydromethanopterin S-methyltransferase subunit B